MTHKIYEIWSEGYAATGEHGTAMCHGTASGETFEHACERFFMSGPNSHLYNKERNSYWACRLFDNEKDARKSFG